MAEVQEQCSFPELVEEHLAVAGSCPQDWDSPTQERIFQLKV